MARRMIDEKVCHSEPVTEVTGVGIRTLNIGKETDCHVGLCPPDIIRNCVGAGDSARPPVEYHPSAVST